MSCISAPTLPTPPGLSLLLPDLVLSPPSLDVTLCCHFELPPIPGFPIILPLGAILAPLGAAVDAIMAVIATVIDLLNSLLDLLQFSCPLE